MVARFKPIVSLVVAALGRANGQGDLGKRVGHTSLPAALGYIITLVWDIRRGNAVLCAEAVCACVCVCEASGAMASMHGVCVRVCWSGTVLGGTRLYRVGNVCLRVASIERCVHEWMCISLGLMKLGACVKRKEYSVCGPGYT